MVQIYFEIGKIIVKYNQEGKEKAEYGKAILKELSSKLTHEFGKGFSVDNLENMRNFIFAIQFRRHCLQDLNCLGRIIFCWLIIKRKHWMVIS